MYATLNVSSSAEPIYYDAGCAGAKGFVCAVSVLNAIAGFYADQ